MVFPRLEFSSAADNSRPYGSHRYDAYGKKIGRRLFLYGELALNGFVALEADSDVSTYCERPIVVTELKPRRVVDFWALRRESAELWLLLRPSEFKWLDQKDRPTAGFCAWAEDHGLAIKLITPEQLGVGGLLQRNWGDVLRYLSANARYTEPQLISKVLELCHGEITIKALQDRLPNEDPILVRTAVFSLLHEGKLRSDDIAEKRLSLETAVRLT